MSGSAGAAASGTPIKIASVGNITGVYGPTGDDPLGLEAWAKYTNAHGGLSGHPVDVTVSDAASNLTAEASEMQTLQANVNPVAFVSVGLLNTAGDIKGINGPIIGGHVGGPEWNQFPVLYPQATSYVTLNYALAQQIPKAKKRFGIIYCEEVPGCAELDTALFADGLAKAAGAKPVYQAKVSSTAPNYTAQCLAAKAANVQTLLPVLPGTAVINLAEQCAQQNYHPQFIASDGSTIPAMATVPALNGMIEIDQNFPYVSKQGGAALYLKAMKQYEPNAPINPATAAGWAAALLFGTVAKKAMSSGATLTSASLKKALASTKNETLNGLAPPLTFLANQPAPVNYCWFVSKIVNSKWTATQGNKQECAFPSSRALLRSVNRQVQVQ